MARLLVYMHVLLVAAAVSLVGAQPVVPIPASEITASASSSFIPSLTGPSLTIDGSGLSGDLHDASSNGATMWLSASGGGGSGTNNPAGIPGPAWLRYQFANPTELSELWVWNHNQANLTDRGLRRVTLHARVTGGAWTSLGDRVLTRAPGTPGYGPGDVIALGGIVATELLISSAPVEGNYGSAFFGLSEVRFLGRPSGCWPTSFPLGLVSVAIDESLSGMLAAQLVGWLGSDVAKSVRLDENRLVWFFGDTFIGAIVDGKRQAGARFINNSIAIQDLSQPAGLQFTYHWGAADTSFFPHQPGTPGTLYWPTSGFMFGGELFIFCYSVASGLNVENATLIRVANPLEHPADWQWQAVDYGVGGPSLGFHTGFHIEGDTILALGYQDQPGGRAAVLARMSGAALLGGALGEALEYWVETPDGPGWSDSPAGLIPLFRPGVTESDVQYLPEFGMFVSTSYNPFVGRINLVFAEQLTGPWSGPFCLYDIPEFIGGPSDIIAYAARPHAELPRATGEIVLSYATNTFGSISPLFTEAGLGLYVPRIIRVQLEMRGNESWLLY